MTQGEKVIVFLLLVLDVVVIVTVYKLNEKATQAEGELEKFKKKLSFL